MSVIIVDNISCKDYLCVWRSTYTAGLRLTKNIELKILKSTYMLDYMPLLSVLLAPVGISSMGQIELYNHLTVCKQMTDVKLNCQCHIAILETI